MARLRFCGFDFTSSGDAISSNSASTTGIALDQGFQIVDWGTGSSFYNPGQTYTVCFQAGRNASDGGALGQATMGVATLNSWGQGSGCSIQRSVLGDPQEIWATFDICHQFTGNNDDPANMMRSQVQWQVFAWGDLTLRIRRVFNYATSPTRADITFEAFNGTTSLGTIPLTGVNSLQWMFVRIRARLDSGTNGRFDIWIDGQSVSFTGINTVATTPLVSATRIFFSGGALGHPSSGGFFRNIGAIDNLLIDDAQFPVGRPSGRRLAVSSDGTLTNWAPSSGSGTLTASLNASDSNKARGTGVGAIALLNLAALTTTGLQTNILGWQVLPTGVSNLDVASAKKLRTGVDVSGTARNGSNVISRNPPLSPSAINPGLDTVFYNGGTTDFTLTDVTNTKLRLEVA